RRVLFRSVGVKRASQHMRAGVHTVWDLPPKKKPNPTEQRQLRAMREGRLVVEPTLARALEPFSGRLGFLDFETIARAVPVWPGMSPWSPAPAQFSYHEGHPSPRSDACPSPEGRRGGPEASTYSHTAFLAEGPE